MTTDSNKFLNVFLAKTKSLCTSPMQLTLISKVSNSTLTSRSLNYFDINFIIVLRNSLK